MIRGKVKSFVISDVPALDPAIKAINDGACFLSRIADDSPSPATGPSGDRTHERCLSTKAGEAMVKTYEVWIDKDVDGSMLSSGTAEQMEDQRSKGLLGAKPRLLFTIQAETYEEMLAVRNIQLGWSPYVPNGRPAHCPTCSAIFY